MLPRNPHFLGKVGQRECGRSAFKPVVAILPGDAVEDDRRELVRRRGERRFGDTAQDGAGREFHDVSFRLGRHQTVGRAKFRSGKGICRLNGPKARARFPLPRGNQCGVGPMVWRRFCF